MFKKNLFCLFGAIFLSLVFVGCDSLKSRTFHIDSPDGTLQVVVLMDNGSVTYTILSGIDTVMLPSAMGIKLRDGSFGSNLSLTEVSKVVRISDSYSMLHGKQKDIEYQANERVFSFTNDKESKLHVVFRVSNDGVAFRYHLPGSSGKLLEVVEENTFFSFPEGTKSWMQPMSEAKTGWARVHPSYEEFYEEGVAPDQISPTGAGWIYPALFRAGDNWVLITETGLTGDYCGTRLRAVPGTGAMKVAFPDPREEITGQGILPNSEGSLLSPWRVLAIGSLKTVMESTLGTDLANPAIEMDQSFIEPGLASWSWVILKDPSMNYKDQERFVEFAADMGWPYTLVDALWDTKLGYDGVKRLVDLGKEKGVGLWLWYNSNGDWNDAFQTPKDKMHIKEVRDAEFKRISDLGVRGVKIDFFPGDGRSVIQLYQDILTSAAEYGIMVNFHGATLPRGWHRTYPHLMTMEAIKGFEFVTFLQDAANAAPVHNTLSTFTRNVFDPMDYTPMVLDTIPNIKRLTTNGHELALPTLFTSGVQHLAETPEGMATVPDYVREYLRDLPTLWDESKFLAGFPGKYLVMARRKGNTWYISGINGQNEPKRLSLDVSFFHSDAYLITDGERWKSFVKKDLELKNETMLSLTMKPYGGFIVKGK